MANPSNLCTLTGTIGKVYNRKQPNVFQFGIQVEDKFELSANNTFGIEVEVEGVLVEYSDDEFIDGVSPAAYCSSKVSKYGWRTKEDGSLRNGGVEFISMPTNGKHLYHVLDNLFKLIPKNADFHRIIRSIFIPYRGTNDRSKHSDQKCHFDFLLLFKLNSFSFIFRN